MNNNLGFVSEIQYFSPQSFPKKVFPQVSYNFSVLGGFLLRNGGIFNVNL